MSPIPPFRIRRLAGAGGGGAYATLSAYLLGELPPDVLLNHEEASGTTATDDSGNGHNFTYSSEANTTYEVAPTYHATQLGNGVDFTTNANAQIENTLPDFGPTCSMLAALEDQAAASGAVIDVEGSERFLLLYFSGQWQGYNGGFVGFGVNAYTGQHTYVMTANGTTWKLYMDGFLVSVATGSQVDCTGDVDGAVGSYNDGTNALNGTHFTSALWGSSELTGANVRAAFEQQNGSAWWYHSKVDDELSLTGTVGYHLALINTAAGAVQLVDCSGNENHGQVNAGTTWAADYTNGHTRYMASATHYLKGKASYLGMTGDFTVAFEFKSEDATTTVRSIAGTSSSTNTYKLNIDASDDLQLTLYDGTNTDTVSVAGSFRDEAWHTIVIRVDQTSGNLDMWVDGVKATGASITATPTGTVQQYFGNAPTSTSFHGYFRNITHFTDALTDDQCAAMFT